MKEENKDIVSIDFYGTKLTTIEKDGERYATMRPIVEGIGLDWGAQQQKLSNNKNKFNCRLIPMVAKDNKPHEMFCVPLKKLNGYLFSINPERVRKDIKDRIILVG